MDPPKRSAYQTAMAFAREEEIALLFTEARTHGAWLDRPVEDALLKRLYELTRVGPSGGNSQPLRLVFVKSHEAKAKLRETLAPLNVEKTMSAPVTAIVAFDVAFHHKLPQLFPGRPEVQERLAALPPAERERLALIS